MCPSDALSDVIASEIEKKSTPKLTRQVLSEEVVMDIKHVSILESCPGLVDL